MVLSAGQAMQLVSPYGGTLQLVFSNATPQQNVQLRLRGVAKHPFLDQSNGAGDKAAFVTALNAAQHEWAEIKLAGIEIHSRADKMRAVINGTDYAGDIDKFLNEVKTLFFEDLYMLAGYALPGESLTAHVQAMCTSLGWNCTDATLHRVPGTQHINVDNYSQCGSGCSGNPYDQDWGLSPAAGAKATRWVTTSKRACTRCMTTAAPRSPTTCSPCTKAGACSVRWATTRVIPA